MVLDSGLFFHPAMRLSTAVENPEGRGNSSQERCCRFLSMGTSSLQMNVTDNLKTVPVVNLEVASTHGGTVVTNI